MMLMSVKMNTNANSTAIANTGSIIGTLIWNNRIQ